MRLIINDLGVMNRITSDITRLVIENKVNPVINLIPYLVPNIFTTTMAAKNTTAIATDSAGVMLTLKPSIGNTETNWLTPARDINA
jgi:hypothetical protein